MSENKSEPQNLTPADVERVGRAYHQKRNVRIIVDSTADYAPGVEEQLGVEVIPFHYVDPEGVEHVDDMWKSRDPHEFYEFMRKNPEAHFHTAAVTPGNYYEVFARAAKEGMPTIYLGLTAGLSSSIDSARQAAQMVRDEFPGFEI